MVSKLNTTTVSATGMDFCAGLDFVIYFYGCCSYLYARKAVLTNKTWGYVLFFTQILVNFAWTPAFFVAKNIGFALAIVVLLDILVLFNIIEFSKVSKTSAKILIPYFIWILFATYLNFGYFVLN